MDQKINLGIYFDEAADMVAAGKPTCNTCGQLLTHFWIESSDDQVLKIAAHCGHGGHSMYIFTFTADDFEDLEQEYAERIYLEVFGDIDSKDFAARKKQEIQDWLHDGNIDGIPYNQLVDEWRQYDIAEITERGV